MIFLDTNAVIYLYTGRQDFSERVLGLIEENDCFISPFVKLELQYLHEVGRSKKSASSVLDSLKRSIGLSIQDHPILELVEVAIDFSWTRDPFDRLITAQAKALKASLVTSDRTILQHYRKAVW